MTARVWAALVAAGLLLTGCGSASRGGGDTDSDKTGDKVVATPGNGGPAGAWTVDGAEVEPGTILRLDGDLTMWTQCGRWSGAWRADDIGLFTGMVSGWQGDDCQPPHDGDPTPRWLREVTAYRIDAGNPRAVDLLDVTGEAVARLVPGTAPAVDVEPRDADPVRSGARAAAPLPSGLTAADRSALVSRWAPENAPTAAPEPSFIEIADDGSWSGSDGCNGANGRWSLGEAGAFGAVAGPTTLMACPGVAVGAAMAQAARAGFDGSALKLFDAAGTELLSLVPDR